MKLILTMKRLFAVLFLTMLISCDGLLPTIPDPYRNCSFGELMEESHQDRPYRYTWLDNSTLMYSAANSKIMTATLMDGKVLLRQTDLVGRTVMASPASELVAIIDSSQSRGARIVDIKNDQPIDLDRDFNEVVWANNYVKVVSRAVVSGNVYLLEGPELQNERLHRKLRYKAILNWSPDDRYMLLNTLEDEGGQDVKLALYDVSTTEMRVLLPQQTGCQLEATWAPDSRRIVGISADSSGTQLFTLDIEGNRYQVLDLNRDAAVFDPAIAPDGTHIAFTMVSEESSGVVHQEVGLYDTQNNTLDFVTDTPHHAEVRPVWSPDGRYLAITSHQRSTGITTLLVLDMKSREFITVDSLPWP